MHRVRNFLILMAALASLSAIFVASASALPVYKFSSQFGGFGIENGQFNGPAAAATDSAGNIWVADGSTGRVQKFNSKGEFLLKITEGKFPLITPTDVAVTSSNNIWVVDRKGDRVVEFNSSGGFIREFGELGSGPGQFWYPTNIAIDSEGNLWVVDESNFRVEEFNSEGKYIRQFGSSGTGNGQFTYISGIATDAEKNVWVVDVPGEYSRIEEFNSSGTYLKQIGSSVLSATLGDVLSIYGGNLWVADSNHDCIKVLNTKGEVLTQFGGVEASEGTMVGPSGTTFDLSGNPWVVNPGTSVMEKWVPTPPVATTEAASGVKASEAVLNAKVNPEGSSTTYQFEYGTTVSYGSKVPASPASAGSGVGEVAVNQTVTKLTPNTTYHYRIVATSAGGTTKGADKTFKTLTATVPQQLEALPVINYFNESFSSLTDFNSNWTALGWGTGGSPKGSDYSTGWGPVETFPGIAGASYNVKQVDSGSGIGVVDILGTAPGVAERYFSLWLDQQTPSSPKSGYELRLTSLSVSSETFNVTLSKWVSGVQTVLASKSSITFPVNKSFALVDQGSTVSVWLKTGTEFTNLLSATDSSFSSGLSGIEGAGNLTRLGAFRTGSL